MEIYKVGGCVRDRILGRRSEDTDYVVVGSTVEDMLSLGYKQVGKDFPVFLHPDTGDEYALARKEISTGSSYKDFSFDTYNVSLREDLERRDLTINSMAIDRKTNEIIDYFGGVSDCKNRILRHTSMAFQEDPVRILRIGRFLARFGPHWTVSTDTLMLSRVMVKEKFDVNKERFWKEFSRALTEKYWVRFIRWIYDMVHIAPEIMSIRMNVLEDTYWHSEETPIDRFMVVCSLIPASMLNDFLIRVGAPSKYSECGRIFNEINSTLKVDPSKLGINIVYPIYRALLRLEVIYPGFNLASNYNTKWKELLSAVSSGVDKKIITSSIPPGPEVGKALVEAEKNVIKEYLYG